MSLEGHSWRRYNFDNNEHMEIKIELLPTELLVKMKRRKYFQVHQRKSFENSEHVILKYFGQPYNDVNIYLNI